MYERLGGERKYVPDDIIIISDDSVPGIKSTTWDSTNFPNLAEYRLVILETDSLVRILHANLNNALRWKNRQEADLIGKRLELIQAQLIRQLRADGDVIAIISGWAKSTSGGSHYLSWAPYDIDGQIRDESGQRVVVHVPRFEAYFELVDRWERVFARNNEGDLLKPLRYFFDNDALEFSLTPIASTTYDEPLGVGLCFWATGEGSVIPLSGRFLCLPPPTKASIPRGIEVLVEISTSDVQTVNSQGAPSLGQSREPDQVAMVHHEQSGALQAIKNPSAKDPRKVFVVHGRNIQARRAMFAFLRAIGLEPIEWSEAVRLTGEASPYIGDVLDIALEEAQAIVVLLSGDDLAYLREAHRLASDPPYESQPTPQARPNVLFEAGMAFGRNAIQTVLVELGELRPISDLAGRHVVRLSNEIGARQNLAHRLERAGCPVKLTGEDWHTAGDFDAAAFV